MQTIENITPTDKGDTQSSSICNGVSLYFIKADSFILQCFTEKFIEWECNEAQP